MCVGGEELLVTDSIGGSWGVPVRKLVWGALVIIIGYASGRGGLGFGCGVGVVRGRGFLVGGGGGGGGGELVWGGHCGEM